MKRFHTLNFNFKSDSEDASTTGNMGPAAEVYNIVSLLFEWVERPIFVVIRKYAFGILENRSDKVSNWFEKRIIVYRLVYLS